MKKSRMGIRKEIQTKIDSLKYTAEETKAVYLQELAQCETIIELQELIKVIDTGEQQLYEIQKALFQRLESYIWKINELNYLSLSDKAKWIEKLIACDFSEEMAIIFDHALAAENKAKQCKSSGWTILKER